MYLFCNRLIVWYLYMEQEVVNLNKGISRSPSFGESGEMSELVNLIPKNGELVAIAPPRDLGIEMGELERLVYIHETYTFRNYIVVSQQPRESPILYYFTDKDNERQNCFHESSLENIISVSSIGNTLIINTDKGLFYSIWRDGRYVSLGDLPEVNISFGLHDWGLTNSDGSCDVSSDSDNQKLSDAVFATINTLVSSIHDRGRFAFPFFVRYAIRLFDGTLTHHSPPVLMLPSSKETIHVYEVDNSLTTALDYRVVATESTLDYRLVSDIDREKWKDIVKSIDIFVSAPFYQYDSSGKVSRITHYTDEQFEEDTYAVAAAVVADANERVYKKQIISHNIYRSHIKLPSLNKEASKKRQLYYYDNGKAYIGYSDERAEQTNNFFENITDCSEFYLLESIDLEDLPNAVGASANIIPQMGYLNTLTLKEVMTDDFRSHDKLYPQGTAVYNNRLNISNVGRELFGGFPTDVMLPYTNDGGDKLYFATELTENGETFTLYNECYNTHSFYGDYLYFPNRNARKMWCVIGEPNFTDGNIFSNVLLNEHTGLNGAAFFSGFDSWFVSTRLPIVPPEASSTHIVHEGNKLYTSEVNNPYVFPLSGVNTIGTGEVIGISTITKALSQGQFGQFPLYVFASDGIWAMEVTSEGLYGSVHAISRDVCNNANSITQIDNAVVFSTEQGLKLLQGSDVVLLSGSMDGINVDETSYNIIEEFCDLFVQDNEQFVAMLRRCRIVYDYPHNALHIFPESGDKHYVYSLDSHAFTTYVGYRLKTSVQANPNTIMQIGNGLYDFGYYQSDNRLKGVAITRPISLGDPFAMKILTDLRIVKRMSKDCKVRIAAWGNNTMDEMGWVRVPSLRQHSFKYYRFVLFTDMTMDNAVSGIGLRYDYRRVNKMR